MLICKQELRSNIWLDWARRFLRQRDADADAKTMLISPSAGRRTCYDGYATHQRNGDFSRAPLPTSVIERDDFSLVPI
jgi:hypothetical protein